MAEKHEKTLRKTLRDHMYREIFCQGKWVLERLPAYEEQARAAVEALQLWQAETLYVCGCGDSYYAGEAAREAFFQYTGKNLNAAEAFEFICYESRYVREGDAVFAISVSGKVGTSLSCLDRAKEKGAKTLGITGTRGSQMWSTADAAIDIMLDVPQEGPVPQTAHYLANMVILFLLALHIGIKKRLVSEDDYKKALEAIAFNLQSIEGNAGMLDCRIRNFALRAAGSYPFVMTGHGCNLATARFGVAKLHEAVCQGHIVQETEEWAHEERQMTKKDTYTIVLAFGAGLQRSKEILKIISSFDSHGIAVTNTALEGEIEAEEIWAVTMADQESFSPMSLKLPLELFACHLAELLDVCPFNFEDTLQTRAIESLIYK